MIDFLATIGVVILSLMTTVTLATIFGLLEELVERSRND